MKLSRIISFLAVIITAAMLLSGCLYPGDYSSGYGGGYGGGGGGGSFRGDLPDLNPFDNDDEREEETVPRPEKPEKDTERDTEATPEPENPEPYDIYDVNNHPLYLDIIDGCRVIAEYRLKGNTDFWGDYDNLKINDTLRNVIDNCGALDYNWGNMVFEFFDPYGGRVLNDFCCTLFPLNEDSQPELFILDKDYNIGAIFTIVEGTPVLLDAYWSRYFAVINDEGELCTHGSGGAADNSSYILELLDEGILVEKYGLISESVPYSFDSEPSVYYYEVIGNTKTMITKEEYDAKMERIPYDHSSLWMGKEVSSLG